MPYRIEDDQQGGVHSFFLNNIFTDVGKVPCSLLVKDSILKTLIWNWIKIKTIILGQLHNPNNNTTREIISKLKIRILLLNSS